MFDLPGSITQQIPELTEGNWTSVNPWNHHFQTDCNVTSVCATFISYLGSPLIFLDGGLYLHSPA
jgi:hypothetical protein